MNDVKEIQLKKVHYFRLVEAGKYLIESLKVEINTLNVEGYSYKLAKLQIELIEAEMAQAYHEDYFDHYNKRCEDHEIWFKQQSDECNEKFDGLLVQAQLAITSKKHGGNAALVKILAGCLELASQDENVNDQGKKNDIFKILKENLPDSI